MPKVERNLDDNIAGGTAIQDSVTTVFVNGRLIMTPNQPVMPHGCCGNEGCDIHCSAKTKGGSSTVFAEGQRVIHNQDVDTCGHKRSTPSPDVFVEK